MLDLPPQDIQMENVPTSHFEHFIALADEEATPAVLDGSVVTEAHTVVVEPSINTEEPTVVDNSVVPEEHSVVVETAVDMDVPAVVNGSVVPEEHSVVVETSVDTDVPAVVNGSVVPEERSVVVETSVDTDVLAVVDGSVVPEKRSVVIEEPTQVAAPAFTEDELKQKAVALKEVFSDGFQWKDLGEIVGQTLDFVIENQNLTPDEIKGNVMTVMNHFIDITDTPYLPDHFTDPIFKAMMPPLIDLLETVLEGKFIMVPTEESEKPTGERLFEFVEKMKEVYADGFTWSDLMVTIRSSVEFMGSFPYLEKAEKEKCVIDIINKIIDETDTPKVPDIFADRIFKAMVPSFVREIFKRLP